VLKKVLCVFCLASAVAAADEPTFTLEIQTGGGSANQAEEAAKALWDDPMARLMRAADAELGHLLIGQPGGRTPPILLVGFRSGVSPYIINASIERNLSSRTTSRTTTIPWPWATPDKPTGLSLEEGLALDLAERLGRRRATAGP